MALQRSTAVDPKLGALNLDPIMQANAIEQQSLVDLNKSILDSVQNYQTKQEEKKQKEIGIKSIQDLMGIDDPKLAGAIYADKSVRDAYKQSQDIQLKKQELLIKYAQEEPFLPTVQNVGGQQLFETEPGKFKFAPTGGGLSARDQKIQSNMSTFGLTRQEALDLVDGNKRVNTDPVSGNTQLVNIRTGVTRQLKLPEDVNPKELVDESLAPGVDASEDSINLYDMATAETTGFVPFLQNKLQGVLGQIDPNIEVIDPENQKKIALFEQTQRTLVKALRSSSKVIASEMQALMKEFDIKPGAFKDVQTMKSTFDALNITINDKINFLREVYGDMNIASKDRAEAMRIEKDLVNFQRYLKVPAVGTDTVLAPKQSDDTSNISNIANKYLNIK